jgi:diguanylate cyclase (GGDEF)-like protein
MQLDLLSRTDPLTGLANRRQLQDALTQTWAQAVASGQPISAIMIDIDFFQLYNDHFGHLGGDDCLRLLAGTVLVNARKTDTVARYGGEELAIILPAADAATAGRTAERIRAAVARLRRENPTAPGGELTVSVGVASADPRLGGSAEDLLLRADRHLYEAKHAGRNRVVADVAVG